MPHFMADWGNSHHLFRVASGANAEDYHWTEVMMRDIPRDLIEGVSLHYYSVIDWNAKGPLQLLPLSSILPR